MTATTLLVDASEKRRRPGLASSGAFFVYGAETEIGPWTVTPALPEC
jgi:hypothetical protein